MLHRTVAAVAAETAVAAVAAETAAVAVDTAAVLASRAANEFAVAGTAVAVEAVPNLPNLWGLAAQQKAFGVSACLIAEK